VACAVAGPSPLAPEAPVGGADSVGVAAADEVGSFEPLRMALVWIVGFSLMGSVGAIALAGSFLLFPEKTRRILIPCLISYATGTLLGAAFLGLIPHALDRIPASPALSTVLIGVVLFFVLEKLVVWRHCHNQQCEVHGTAGPLLLVGDAFHNFVDGVIIATTFVTSIPLGLATSLSVVAHEVPQEVGDLAILLESGYSRQRALAYNTLSGLSTLPGAIIAYLTLQEIQRITPYIMALSAASFVYIAIADLVPSLHRHTGPGSSVRQLTLMLAGIGTIALFHLGR
jgi:zinc and cadmium transporter